MSNIVQRYGWLFTVVGLLVGGGIVVAKLVIGDLDTNVGAAAPVVPSGSKGARAPKPVPAPAAPGNSPSEASVPAQGWVRRACSDERRVRFVVDNSASMRGYFDDKILMPGLRSLGNQLLNAAERAVQPGADGRLRREVLFVGGSEHAQVAAAEGNSCRIPADCGKGQACCEPAGASLDEPLSLQCLPPTACGPVLAGAGNQWNEPEQYRATRSRVSRAFPLLFDPCAEAAILLTDGMETPENPANEPCAAKERSPYREPGLGPLLSKHMPPGGDGWGVWVVRALVPFRGKVYLECGRPDAELRLALGNRLKGGNGKGEAWFQTSGVELQPILLTIVSQAGPESVQRIAAELEHVLTDFAADASSAEAKGATEPKPLVEVVQVWPVSTQHVCARSQLDLYAADNGKLQLLRGPLAAYHGFVTARLSADRPAAPAPRVAQLFGFANPKVRISVDGRDEASSAAYLVALKAATVVSPTGNQGVLALNRAKTLLGCAERAAAMARAPSLPLPAAQLPGFEANFLIDAGCVASQSTLDLNTRLHRSGKKSAEAQGLQALLEQPAQVEFHLVCSPTVEPGGLEALDRLRGTRFAEPQTQRGIPGIDALVGEIKTWAAAQKPRAAVTSPLRVPIARP